MPTREGVSRAVHAMNREVRLLVELERSAVTDGTALDGLRASWSRLAGLLDVGPVPRSARCPHCGRVGEPDALHCWTCWEELVPVNTPADGGHRGEGRS